MPYEKTSFTLARYPVRVLVMMHGGCSQPRLHPEGC